jgi:hypothetical protein
VALSVAIFEWLRINTMSNPRSEQVWHTNKKAKS